jgi:hypothetical protein
LHLSVDHPALVEASIDPLEQMKDGAREVAISVRDVMTNKKSDAIPTWLFVSPPSFPATKLLTLFY